jgi:hypothetical protein
MQQELILVEHLEEQVEQEEQEHLHQVDQHQLVLQEEQEEQD